MSETLDTSAPVETSADTAPVENTEQRGGDDLRSVIQRAYADSVGRDAPQRDDRGRFAAGHNGGPPLEPEVQAEESAAPAEEPTATEAVERPSSWSESDWSALTPEARERVAVRERDLMAALEERVQHTQEVERFRQAAAPYDARLRELGVDAPTAFQRLLEWEHAIRQDPARALPALAQTFGFDLRTLVPNGAQVDPQPQQFRDPRVDQILAQQQAREADEKRRSEAQTAAQIEAFRADSRNVHFDAVRVKMGHLMMADPSLTLQDAYDAAIWADPKLRADRLKAETAAREAERRKAETERAKAARAASVGLRDSAGSGVNGHSMSTAGMTLRDTIRAAMREQG